MPKVTVTVPHNDPIDDAVEKVAQVIGKALNDFQGKDIEIHWDNSRANFSLTSLGFKIKGDVVVGSSSVVANVELPFAAIAFKGKVKESLTKKLTRTFGDD